MKLVQVSDLHFVPPGTRRLGLDARAAYRRVRPLGSEAGAALYVQAETKEARSWAQCQPSKFRVTTRSMKLTPGPETACPTGHAMVCQVFWMGAPMVRSQ